MSEVRLPCGRKVFFSKLAELADFSPPCNRSDCMLDCYREVYNAAHDIMSSMLEKLVSRAVVRIDGCSMRVELADGTVIENYELAKVGSIARELLDYLKNERSAVYAIMERLRERI